ncbi:MAG: beta-ketoacyl synthase N-terminal-like domain-containing protein [Limisphaerales bacterium]
MRGPNVATCSACATASHAIGEAWRTLVMGDADVMLAGGTEAAVNPDRHERGFASYEGH